MVALPHLPAFNGTDSLGLALAPSDVEEFRLILRDDCGENLSFEDAWTRATQVLALFQFFLEWTAKGPERRTVELPGGP